MKKKPIIKPKQRQKNVRKDPFERAWNLARKKYDRAENELAKAQEKIEALQNELPGLRALIAGMEIYFEMEPSFGQEELPNTLHVYESQTQGDSDQDAGSFPAPTLQKEEITSPAKKGRRGKPGEPQLYTCKKCGAYTATDEAKPICSSCGSSQLVHKDVGGPKKPINGGVAAVQPVAELPAAGDDDQFLAEDTTGLQAKQ